MTSKGTYLNALESAIKIRHKCSPTHRQTVFVRAKTEADETVWEGFVEEFEVVGHATAKICYAWQHMEPKGRSKIIAIPRNSFVDSPQKAVEAAIFTDAQPVQTFSEEMESLAKQLEECKKLIHRMGNKSEDLAVLIDSVGQEERGWRKGSDHFEI